VKHSGATRIDISVGADARAVVFVVADNGRGFDVAAAWRTGAKGYSSLQDMRAQMESAGGMLDLVSAPGQGTQIKGSMPTDDRKGGSISPD
jgi:two-component system NarL family sensor kinase